MPKIKFFMKRKALILIAAALFLSGCTTVNIPPNTVKPAESSKEDISPSTGKSENTSVETTTTDITINETNTDHSPPPVSTEINSSTPTPVSQYDEITFTLYTLNSNADGLNTQTVMLPGDNVTSVFNILAAHNVISSDVTLNYLNEYTQDGKKY